MSSADPIVVSGLILHGYKREWAKFPSLQRVYDILIVRKEGSLKTFSNYILSVKRFCEFLGYDNPERLLEDVKAGKVDVVKALDDFISASLKKASNRTVGIYAIMVKKWLQVNGVEADFDRVVLPTGSYGVVDDRAPTREELKRLLNVADLRDRVLILIAISSGLRIGTILSLKFGDVDFNYPDVAKITVRNVRGRGRKLKGRGRTFFTFITPEAKRALLEYKEYRERLGEKITDDSPLITSSFGVTKKELLGKPINVNSYRIAWNRLLRKAGLTGKSGGWFELHFHTLRKFFSSQCINAGVKSAFKEFWMGHKGAYLDDSYFRASEEDHLREYRKAIPYLSVYEAPVLVSKENLRKEVLSALLEAGEPEFLKPIAEKYGISVETLKNLLFKIKAEAESKKSMAPPMMTIKKRVDKAETEDSEDCQKIVSEDELPAYLKCGWKVQAVLPSGKIVIEK